MEWQCRGRKWIISAEKDRAHRRNGIERCAAKCGDIKWPVQCLITWLKNMAVLLRIRRECYSFLLCADRIALIGDYACSRWDWERRTGIRNVLSHHTHVRKKKKQLFWISYQRAYISKKPIFCFSYIVLICWFSVSFVPLQQFALSSVRYIHFNYSISIHVWFQRQHHQQQ